MKYVYVMSHAFSGSTLMSFLLGAHPEIATVGELGIAPGIDVEDFLCSCGQPIRTCPFWKSVSASMEERGLDFDVRRAGLRFRVEGDVVADRLLRAGTRGRILELIRAVAIRVWPNAHWELRRLLHRHESLVAVVAKIRNRDVFVDISKRPGNLIHLRRIQAFDVRVIRLMRDARAVVSSCMKNLGMTPEEAARSWMRFFEESENAIRLFDSACNRTIRYEDLCVNPVSVLAEIQRWIGVTPYSQVPDFRAVEHHIIGNRMRLQSVSEVRLDDSWRRSLTKSELELVEQIAGTVNRRLGYSGE